MERRDNKFWNSLKNHFSLFDTNPCSYRNFRNLKAIDYKVELFVTATLTEKIIKKCLYTDHNLSSLCPV